MPLLKIGSSTYNDKTTPVYLMQGNATRDAENKPVNGKDHAVVGVAAAEDKQGNTVFVSLNGWGKLARYVRSIERGDNILAVGRLKTREYQGRAYYDLDADFLCKNGAGFTCSAETPPMGELPEFGGGDPAGGFAEIEEDGELPF